MTTYSISLRHIKIHPMVQTELIPHGTRQGWNLVLQVRSENLKTDIFPIFYVEELTNKDFVL